MRRLIFSLLLCLTTGCDDVLGEDGGECAYEEVEAATCALSETTDGLVLQATGESGASQEILLAEGDSCLASNGYGAGDTFSCALWELAEGACAPIDVMVEGPASDCEF